MTVDQRRALASSFGSAAEAYAEHRPDYPQSAVRWALASAPGTRVLDLGAGTGKLSAVLVAMGADVRAVEPDTNMLTELRRGLPSITALSGSAEHIPLPDGSVDAVLAGNAMHWFDMDLAVPELSRVLGDRGVVAGLWNTMDDTVDWVARLATIAGAAAIGPRDTPRGWRDAVTDIWPRTSATVRFTAPELAEFRHEQSRTAQSLVATLGTKAGVLVMPPRDREELLQRIGAFLTGEPETAGGHFALPMVTCVLRVQKTAL